VPFDDLAYLTTQNAIRTNGSATAQEASLANLYVALGASWKFSFDSIANSLTTLPT
jgi:hypothetical protein